jgi:hypothetical protein
MPAESLEAQVARIDERTENLNALFMAMHAENKTRLDSQDAKLDRLLRAFDMGRGGAVAAAKIGGLIVLALGAMAWLADHLHGWFK